jgi:chorismate mutase
MMNKIFLLTGSLIVLTMSNKALCQSRETTPKDTVLENKRLQIDSLDKRLFEILGARERVVKEIGVYKAKNKIPPLQAARFQQVLEKGIAAGKMEGLSEEFCTELLNAIHKESLRIETVLP